MTDSERKALLARIASDTKAVKQMPAEEARKRLVEGGIYREDGRLSPRYGGKPAARE